LTEATQKHLKHLKSGYTAELWKSYEQIMSSNRRIEVMKTIKKGNLNIWAI